MRRVVSQLEMSNLARPRIFGVAAERQRIDFLVIRTPRMMYGIMLSNRMPTTIDEVFNYVALRTREASPNNVAR